MATGSKSKKYVYSFGNKKADGNGSMKPLLGGKGANLVFADADPKAVKQGIIRCFNNTGQSCNAPTRMLVERSRYDEAVEQAKDAAEATQVNAASQEGRHIGPLVSEMQFNKVQDLIQKGIDEGARLVTGGVGRPEGLNRGFYVRPTVFADCNNDMQIMREEIFGPVLSMMPFDSEDEAIAIANSTPFGLGSGVFTQNVARAHRVSARLKAGICWVNTYRAISPIAPFGGYDQSGYGREAGLEAIHDYTRSKTTWISTSDSPMANPFVMR